MEGGGGGGGEEEIKVSGGLGGMGGGMSSSRFLYGLVRFGYFSPSLSMTRGQHSNYYPPSKDMLTAII